MKKLALTIAAIALLAGSGAQAASKVRAKHAHAHQHARKAHGAPFRVRRLAGLPLLTQFVAAGPGPTPGTWGVVYPDLYYNNGGLRLPLSVTGGGKGVGSINLSGGYYVNGVNIANIPVQPSSMPAFTGGDCTSNAGTVVLTCSPFARTASANTFSQPQTFSQAPKFPSLNGYIKANSGTGATAAATVPTSDLANVLLPAQFPALTGDVTTTAGSLTTTLATVNSTPGSFGGAASVPTFTVNAKGLLTASGAVAVAAPAGTLTGGTLASNVLTSSLTALGTVTTGVWNASPINPTYIVTGTSGANLCLLNANCTFSGTNIHNGTETFATLNVTTLAASGTATAPTVATADNSTNVATTALTTNKINAAIAGLPLGQGFRNRIINGDFRIDQKNAGSSFSNAANALTYSVDRFYIYSGGAAVTAQRLATGSSTFKNFINITGAASNTGVNLGQRMESGNVYDLAGKTVSFQAVLACSSSRTVGWTVWTANASDNFGGGQTNVGNASTWAVTTTPTLFTGSLTLPTSAQNGVAFEINFGAILNGTNCTATGIQFELGSTPTAFEQRFIGADYAFAQRYYQYNVYGYASGTATASGITVGTSINFPPMRANPTFTTGTQGGTNTSAASVGVKSNTAANYTATTSASGGYILEGYFSLSAEML